MNKRNSTLRQPRLSLVPIQIPLQIFWNKSVGESLPEQTKKRTRPTEPTPSWREIKYDSHELTSSFSLPKTYIVYSGLDEDTIEYGLDSEDEAFLETLQHQDFVTKAGRPFIVSAGLIEVTFDYLEKHSIKKKPSHLGDIRQEIENTNGCVLPKAVFIKIFEFWKKKKSDNGSVPLIPRLLHEREMIQSSASQLFPGMIDLSPSPERNLRSTKRKRGESNETIQRKEPKTNGRNSPRDGLRPHPQKSLRMDSHYLYQDTEMTTQVLSPKKKVDQTFNLRGKSL